MKTFQQMTIKPVFKTILFLTLLAVELTFLAGCKEDPVVPTLSTSIVTEITVSTATAGGDITSDGGAEITARGVCWGTASQPVVAGPA
jgi:hypothetical protein